MKNTIARLSNQRHVEEHIQEGDLRHVQEHIQEGYQRHVQEHIQEGDQRHVQGHIQEGEPYHTEERLLFTSSALFSEAFCGLRDFGALGLS